MKIKLKTYKLQNEFKLILDVDKHRLFINDISTEIALNLDDFIVDINDPDFSAKLIRSYIDLDVILDILIISLNISEKYDLNKNEIDLIKDLYINKL